MLKINMKKILLILCLCLLCACSSKTKENNIEITNTAEPSNIVIENNIDIKREVYLSIPYQYTTMTGTRLEMVQLNGDLTENANQMNSLLKKAYDDAYNKYKDDLDYEFGLLTVYPMSNAKYLNVSYIYRECPCYGTYGDIVSLVYDIENDHMWTVEERLKQDGLSIASLEQELKPMVASETKDGLNIESIGFSIDEDDKTTYYINYNVNEIGAGPWASYYKYYYGVVEPMGAHPINELEMDIYENNLSFYVLDMLDRNGIASNFMQLGLNVEYARQYTCILQQGNTSLFNKNQLIVNVEKYDTFDGHDGCYVSFYLETPDIYERLESYFVSEDDSAIYLYDVITDSYSLINY